ncbi:uncharacterized protein LOC142351638 [Convolutriloba macropyga]|uniref:uncharacterized protein LOC142351638 n=1 Tax=Convolutriloba macropyga TaxID=536237 RepID=UPI003F52519B
MADNQTGGPQRLRLDSQKLCKAYYPTVDELIHSEDEVLTKLFSNMKVPHHHHHRTSSETNGTDTSLFPPIFHNETQLEVVRSLFGNDRHCVETVDYTANVSELAQNICVCIHKDHTEITLVPNYTSCCLPFAEVYLQISIYYLNATWKYEQTFIRMEREPIMPSWAIDLFKAEAGDALMVYGAWMQNCLYKHMDDLRDLFYFAPFPPLCFTHPSYKLCVAI